MAVFPDLLWSSRSNPLRYVAELCSALELQQAPDLIAGPLFGRGRDVFQSWSLVWQWQRCLSELSFEGTPILSFSARKDPQFLQWRPFQMGRKGLSVGTREEEITTLRCENHPAVERGPCFPEANSNAHFHSPEKWCNRWLQAKWLAFLNACCAIPPSFPKPLFSPHLTSHAIFDSTLRAQYPKPWANKIQHSQWTVWNTVHLKTSADTASHVVTVLLHVLLEEGDTESLKLIQCLQSNKAGHYVTEKLKIQQFLQKPTYQLSKEPGTDNLHLFCFLLLLQKKSMHPTLITSRKSQKNLKVQHLREPG